MHFQKAWFYYGYGSKDVLQYGDVPVPELGDDQVLVRVLAAALNPIDSNIRNGLFKDLALKHPVVPGTEMAGVIVDAGSKASLFGKGDEVYANIQDFKSGRAKQYGTLTQYTAVEESLIALKPANMSFEEAASFPLSLQISQGCFDKAKFQRGQSVFIVGQLGDVQLPALATQIAKHVYGASKITVSTSARNMDLLRKLGADHVVDCTKTNYTDISEKFDFVFDAVGDSWNSYVLAKEGGEVIDIMNPSPHPKASFFVVTPSGNNLERFRSYIECEKLKPVMDPTSPYAFSDVVEAFRLLESGKAQGKVVISRPD